MAHFAKLDSTCTVVLVTCGSDANSESELQLSARTGDTYRKCSYNTKGGVHYTNGEPSTDQSQAFRKNYPAIGYRYDIDRDAFIPPKPYPSWTLNETTCLWDAPASMPERPNDEIWVWDEETQNWNNIF